MVEASDAAADALHPATAGDTHVKPAVPARGARMTAYDVFVDWFTDKFTGHAIPRALETEPPIVYRLFWIALVVACIVNLTYGTVAVIQEYFEFPVASSVSAQDVPQHDFPRVAICPSTSFISGSKPEDLYTKEGFARAAAPAWLTILGLEFDGEPHLWAPGKEEVQGLIDNGTLEVRRIQGDWGGACVVFNPGNTATSTSTFNTLSMQLSLDQYWFPHTSYGFGAPHVGWTLIILPPGTSFTPAVNSENRFLIAPGSLQNIKIQPRRLDQTKRQRSGGFHCSDNTSYHRLRCLDEWMEYWQLRQCGCAEDSPTAEEYCYNSQSVDMPDAVKKMEQCVEATYGREAEFLRQCEQRCVVDDYEYTHSTCAYPSYSVYQSHLNESIATVRTAAVKQFGFGDAVTQKNTYAYARETVAAVQISFQTMTRQVTSMALVYGSWFVVFQKVGGLWSFWLGFSIITMVEIAFFPLMYLPWCGKWGGGGQDHMV